MSLILKIKDKVESMPMTFVYHAQEAVNEMLDKTVLPAVACYLNQNSNLVNNIGNYCEQSDVLLMFIAKTNFDFNSLTNEAIIETMKLKAFEFVRLVRESSDLKIVGNIRLKKFYDEFDVNITGVGLDITLSEVIGDVECTTFNPPTPITPDIPIEPIMPIDNDDEYQPLM